MDVVISNLLDFNKNKVEDLSNNDLMLKYIRELRKESHRKRNIHAYHLHDYIAMLATSAELQSELKILIQKRIASHPHEVNERTYWGRTACHWAMFYNQIDILPLLLKEGKADLSLTDLDLKKPMDLIEETVKDQKSSPRTQVVIKKCSKEDYTSIFSAFGCENSDTKDLSINYITDSMSLLKLHHIEHDAQSMIARDQYVSEITLDGQDEPSSHISRSKRNRKVSEIQATLLGEEVKGDNVEYIKRFLREGNSPNALVQPSGMPLLLYSFVHAKKRVFRLLLSHGASVKSLCDEQGLVFLNHHLAPNVKNRIRVLVETRNVILNLINVREIKKIQLALSQTEEAFHRELVKLGLTAHIPNSHFFVISPLDMKSLSEKNQLPIDLVNAVYELCSCVHSDEKADPNNRKFDPKVISQMLLALTTVYRPSLIIATLKSLYPLFCTEQKLLALFVAKEIVTKDALCDRENRNYVINVSLPLFLHVENREGYQDLKKGFQELVNLKQNEASDLLRIYYEIEDVLSRHLSYTHKSSFLESKTKSAKLMANELRALTLQFYHLVNPNEFVDQHWQKPNKEKLAPTICQHQRLFDQISDFIKHQILSMSSKKDRVAVLSLWIDTLTELLEDPLPDYDGAMLVLCSLNNSSILRLKSTFDSLSRNSRLALERAEEKLSPNGNFGNLRKLMKENPLSLPFLGMTLRDVTYAYENRGLETLKVMGPILADFTECQNRLKMVHLPVQTDFPFFIHHCVQRDNDFLHELSHRIEPPVISLKGAIDAALLKKVIQIYLDNGFGLIVDTSQGILEGEQAFNALLGCLKEKCQQGRLDFNHAKEILRIAKLTISPEEEYSVNPLFFMMPSSTSNPKPFELQRQRAMSLPGASVAPAAAESRSDGVKKGNPHGSRI